MQVKSLRGKDFIRISDFTKEEIVTMLDAGKALKLENARGVPHEILKGQTIFLMFYAKSLRTRNSFETGIFQLGGHANFLTTDAVYEPAVEGKEQAYVTERLDDVANVLSRYGEAICIRISRQFGRLRSTVRRTSTCVRSPRRRPCRSSTWKTTSIIPARAWPTS